MSSPVESMYRAVEYIEAHLQSEINIAQVADAVGYSLFHFIRTFDRMVHHTPYDYLMRRRLTEAARALAASNRRVIDIAQDFCFNNHETFTRAFKRLFNVQPSEWREKNLIVNTMLMPPKTLEDLRFINQAHFQYPQVVALLECPLSGLMTPLNTGEIARQQRAQAVASLCSALNNSAAAQFVGVTIYLEQSRENAYYFAGVEKANEQAGMPRLAEYTIPGGPYARIAASSAERGPALNYLYFIWLPRVGLKPAGSYEVERFTADLQGNSFMFVPLLNTNR